MTQKLFHQDAYLKTAPAKVQGHSQEGGLILDQSIFYPQGGGQPGDNGTIEWDGGSLPIATTIKGPGDDIILIPGAPELLPPPGAEVTQTLDWGRRFRHMRMHTALHLLSVAVPLPVSGGAISVDKGRLDFDMPEVTFERDTLERELNELVAQDLPISEEFITDAQLRAQPELVKTMSVMPPMGQGQVRLIAIGNGGARIDLQPCGGTHVVRCGEIGQLRLGKIQKKGRQNRRIYLHLDG